MFPTSAERHAGHRTQHAGSTKVGVGRRLAADPAAHGRGIGRAIYLTDLTRMVLYQPSQADTPRDGKILRDACIHFTYMHLGVEECK